MVLAYIMDMYNCYWFYRINIVFRVVQNPDYTLEAND